MAQAGPTWNAVRRMVSGDAQHPTDGPDGSAYVEPLDRIVDRADLRQSHHVLGNSW